MKAIAEYRVGFDKSNGFYGNPPEELIPKIIVFQEWYFHGKIEQIFNSDFGYIYDFEGVRHKTQDIILPNDYQSSTVYIHPGIYPVTVYGLDKPCVGFFWSCESRSHGYIVLEEDYDAIKDAQQLYINKSDIY